MNKLLLACLVIAIISIGFIRSEIKRQTSPLPNLMKSGSVITAPSPVQEPPPIQPIIIKLSAQSNSNEQGVATLIPEGNKTIVVIDLQGAPKGIPQPAQIHEGSCELLGDEKYALESPVNGISETIINVPIQKILSELPLAINVHKSKKDMPTYYACGDILANQGLTDVSSR